jgi:DNA-binding MarR family transcriptional regulator
MRGTVSVDAGLSGMAGRCICGNLRMASRLVTAYYDAALRPAGIEANQMIMLWVAHSSDRMSAREVAYAAGMDQSTASRNLAVLEDRGLVTLAASREDRRERLVSLTARGRAALVRAFPRWQKAQDELQALAADVCDLEKLGRVLRKVSRRMQNAD